MPDPLITAVFMGGYGSPPMQFNFAQSAIMRANAVRPYTEKSFLLLIIFIVGNGS